MHLSLEQVSVLLSHCAHARYVWNLCVEQGNEWRPGRGKMPGLGERCRQLTEARADNPWLAAGSAVVQQQAIRDHDQAMQKFFAGTHGRPSWRKAGCDEGFRVVGVEPSDVRRLNRKWAEIKIPKAGLVRFRMSRPVPEGVKSFRVTRDSAGRWHIAFAHIPDPVPAPGTGGVVGIDRGVVVSAALSTGELLRCPRLNPREQARLLRLERRQARARRGSNRRVKVKVQTAWVKARETDRRRNWAEKTSTDLARRFDVIRVEDLRIKNMTRSAKGTSDRPGRNVAQKTGLNKGIRQSGWGILVRRLEEKAPGRVEKVPPAYTSQRCSACGHVAAESRESQALFRCVACNFACNADVNAARNIAARNIAAGYAVNARGGDRDAGPVNREPQLALLPA
jgi:putative transposase